MYSRKPVMQSYQYLHRLQTMLFHFKSVDVHLIEIDKVHTDVVYSNVELNGAVLKAKQDTGAQINVLSKTVFQTLQKECKLPLYPKTCVKLVGYGKKVTNYLSTTKIKC